MSTEYFTRRQDKLRTVLAEKNVETYKKNGGQIAPIVKFSKN